ncbi:10440_t:CDS:2 [Paraglomus occultum]|uniref:10440_t:CDS:1 n=1 Tax=Paraglomus occultum TaxID=144539 RepID=A0A9N9AP97_9GLOM|nr:10440_t:CDS:2 [Paraglomus occultum]
MGNKSSKAVVDRTNEILAEFTVDERALSGQWLSEETKNQSKAQAERYRSGWECQDIAKLGVEFWFDRDGNKKSGKKVADGKRNDSKNQHDNEKGCGSNEVAGDQNEALVEYLLVQPSLKQGEVEDENAESNFMKECLHGWYFSLDKYTEWYNNNLPFQKLTNTAMARCFNAIYRKAAITGFTSRACSLQLVRLQQKSMLTRPEISSPFPYPAFSNLLTPADYFCICQHLPPDCVATPHQLLFSSIIDVKSWTSFFPPFFTSYQTKVENLQIKRYNDHYQYLNSGTETLRNGLGMGGQLEYPALWIEEGLIRGESRAGPVSTTYGSVCLIWLVKPTTRDPNSIPNGAKHSVLDRHPAELELLEMATSKKTYSKDVREPDVLHSVGDDE